jgi:hypothetical protein
MDMKQNGINYEVIPHYVDEILVNDSKSHKALINKANAQLSHFSTGDKYEFDGDECAIEMEFYDGIALATNGCGLYMTYPTLAEVAKSPVRQSKIQDYIGIYDGTINQHDVALLYGVLKFDENKTKISTSMKMQTMEHETLVLMSADIYQKIYNMSEVFDFSLAASLVRDAALRFERKWWEMKADDKDDLLDYIIEMDKFEEEELARLRELYDNPSIEPTMALEANDAIDEAITNASRILADEAFIQNGQREIANDHDDTWFELQEKVREAMLEAASKVISTEPIYS